MCSNFTYVNSSCRNTRAGLRLPSRERLPPSLASGRWTGAWAPYTDVGLSLFDTLWLNSVQTWGLHQVPASLWEPGLLPAESRSSPADTLGRNCHSTLLEGLTRLCPADVPTRAFPCAGPALRPFAGVAFLCEDSCTLSSATASHTSPNRRWHGDQHTHL